MQYVDKNFDCRYFAETLWILGRVQNYQIGIVHARGYNTETNAQFNHAFNITFTTEGLNYIEPQDFSFYDIHCEIEVGKEYDMKGFGRIHITNIEIPVQP